MENQEEKMKKRIFLSIILAAVMVSAMLAGCSSGGSAAPKEEPGSLTPRIYERRIAPVFLRQIFISYFS